MPNPDPATVPEPTSVLFVCLGNICRSPLAEGVLEHLVRDAGGAGEYHVDSAGTAAYHVGEPPDPRSAEVALRRAGFELRGSARKVEPADFSRFDWIFAMDRSNLRALESAGRGHTHTGRLLLLREFDPEAEDGDRSVPDPYYGGPEGFDLIYDQIERSCRAWLDHVGLTTR